jgi:hypothetical protein
VVALLAPRLEDVADLEAVDVVGQRLEDDDVGGLRRDPGDRLDQVARGLDGVAPLEQERFEGRQRGGVVVRQQEAGRAIGHHPGLSETRRADRTFAWGGVDGKGLRATRPRATRFA